MAKDSQSMAASGESQKQMAAADDAAKRRANPEDTAKNDEPVHFDTTVAKLVERENADGDKEWVEVMSDNLYPGEKLKRADDEERAADKALRARRAAHEAADERGTNK